MNRREIITLMHRLFYGDLPNGDAYVLLGTDSSKLERVKVDALLDRYIDGPDVLLFVNENNCLAVRKGEAFKHIERMIQLGRVKVADPRFHGRVIIEPSGVGAGSAL
jgi:hypothetical protein